MWAQTSSSIVLAWSGSARSERVCVCSSTLDLISPVASVHPWSADADVRSCLACCLLLWGRGVMALTVTIAQLTDSRSVVMEQKEQVEKQCRKCTMLCIHTSRCSTSVNSSRSPHYWSTEQLQSRLKRIADLEDRNRAVCDVYI